MFGHYGGLSLDQKLRKTMRLIELHTLVPLFLRHQFRLIRFRLKIFLTLLVSYYHYLADNNPNNPYQIDNMPKESGSPTLDISTSHK